MRPHKACNTFPSFNIIGGLRLRVIVTTLEYYSRFYSIPEYCSIWFGILLQFYWMTQQFKIRIHISSNKSREQKVPQKRIQNQLQSDPDIKSSKIIYLWFIQRKQGFEEGYTQRLIEENIVRLKLFRLRLHKLRLSWLRPPGLRLSWLRPPGLRLSWLRPPGLRLSWLRPPGLRLSWLRPPGLRFSRSEAGVGESRKLYTPLWVVKKTLS